MNLYKIYQLWKVISFFRKVIKAFLFLSSKLNQNVKYAIQKNTTVSDQISAQVCAPQLGIPVNIPQNFPAQNISTINNQFDRTPATEVQNQIPLAIQQPSVGESHFMLNPNNIQGMDKKIVTSLRILI